MKIYTFLAFILMICPAHASEKGLELSEKLCARCHAIDPAKPWNSIGSTPSFMLMAKKFDRYKPRVLTLGGRRPHTGQKLNPTKDELASILDYISTLIK